MTRVPTFCLAALLLAPLVIGCAGESDKKGINKDRDRPVPAKRTEGHRAGEGASRAERGDPHRGHE